MFHLQHIYIVNSSLDESKIHVHYDNTIICHGVYKVFVNYIQADVH